MAEKKVNIDQHHKSLVNTSQFAELVIVGVKKVETFSFTKTEEEVNIYEDILEAVETKQHSGKVMLGFFSIPNLAGEHIDKIDAICNFNENINENILRQSLKKVALIDYAEAIEEHSQEANFIIAADCIIHWDNNGSYIQPTDEHSYMFDLEELIGGYPANYNIHVYTNRDLTSFKSRKIELHKVTDLPVMQSLWYNQPSFQQLYGNMVLIASLAVLAITYGIISWQESSLDDFNRKISNLSTIKVNNDFYTKSNQDLKNLEKSLVYKDISKFILKDLSNSLNSSGFKTDRIFLERSSQNQVIARIISKLNTHMEFSSQEPLAKRIIDNSMFIKAIRKKLNKEQRLELEALIDLKDAKKQINKLTKRRG